MTALRAISRILTIFIPYAEARKKARLHMEELLNQWLRTEKYKYTCLIRDKVAQFQMLPRDDFHVVSLGTNCFPRLTLSQWKLKPLKKEGELSMPFDLAVHPLAEVVKNLQNRFEGYFEALEFDKRKGYWLNPERNIQFIHDNNPDINFMRERYQRRIDNLYQALADEKPCLIVCYVDGEVESALINQLYHLLQSLCEHKKFKLVVALFNGKIAQCDENICFYKRNFPYRGYSYMDRYVKYTKAGYEFEAPFADLCYREIEKLLEK